jgi:hypothetical protein
VPPGYSSPWDSKDTLPVSACRISAARSGEGAAATDPPFIIRPKLSDARTCPQSSIFGGLAVVACSLLTGQTNTEWYRRESGSGISICRQWSWQDSKTGTVTYRQVGPCSNGTEPLAHDLASLLDRCEASSP